MVHTSQRNSRQLNNKKKEVRTVLYNQVKNTLTEERNFEKLLWTAEKTVFSQRPCMSVEGPDVYHQFHDT